MKKRCLNILENRNAPTGKTDKPAQGKTSVTISAVTLLLILLASCASAIPPRHNASAITEGTFNSGNYTFPDSLNITNFLEAASIFFVNPITQKVGIGIANPDTPLHVSGDVKIEGALNTTGDVFLPTQSLSGCSGKLITDTHGNITCAPDESYNSTYDLYAYNQTTPAIDYVNGQGYLTNESDPLFTAENVSLWQESQNKYNATYDTWAYNQTTPALDYVNAQGYLTNESDPVFATENVSIWSDLNNKLNTNDQRYNETSWILGQGYLTGESDPLFLNENTSLWQEAQNKYNSTYDLWAYNQTTPAIDYVNAQGFLGSADNSSLWLEALNKYNSTYDTYAYNQTTPAIDYLNQLGYLMNGSSAELTSLNVSGVIDAYGITINGTDVGTGSADLTNVAYVNQTNTFTSNQTFSDSAFITKSLGVGTTGPGQTLDVRGTGYFSGNLGVGTNPGTVMAVNIDKTFSSVNPSGSYYGYYGLVRIAATDNTVHYYGASLQAATDSATFANAASITGFRGTVDHIGHVTLPTATGVKSLIKVGYPSQGDALQVITNAYNFYGESPFIDTAGGAAGSIETAYGIYLEAQKVINVTNGYGIYQAGTSDINYFGGNVGINTTFPLQVLDVNGVMRLSPTDSPGNCNSTLKGSLYFDDSMSEPCFCNSTDWSQFDGGGACT